MSENVAAAVIAGPQLMASREGFGAIVRMGYELEAYRNANLNIHFNQVRWMDAHLAPSILTIVRRLQSRGNTVTFFGMSEQMKAILKKNKFLSSPIFDNYNTTIPVTEFSLENHVEFSQYVKRHLDRKEIPKMTRPLRSKIFEAVDELFANCSLHSKSLTRVCAGGQFYPRKGIISFVVSDGGQGIKGALIAAGRRPLPAEEAINWAMSEGSTTRQGDIPGGLGLKVLRQFLRMNGGRLIVVSNDGYWCETSRGCEYGRLPNAFPGTSVVLDIVTSDMSSYDYVDAPSPKGIW